MHAFTVGHGIRPLTELLDTLREADMRTLVDVRRFPASRRNPQFNQRPLEQALGDGIGLNNVNERLRTIYGVNYRLKLTSTPGAGTCARMEIPELSVPERVIA